MYLTSYQPKFIFIIRVSSFSLSVSSFSLSELVHFHYQSVHFHYQSKFIFIISQFIFIIRVSSFSLSVSSFSLSESVHFHYQSQFIDTDNTTGSDQRKKVCYWQYHWVRSKEESMLLITSTPISMVMVSILTSSLKLKCKFYYFISDIHITGMRTCSAYVILILRM